MEININENFWNNIKEMLKRRGETHSIFAARLNINERTFQDWVYSKKIPDMEKSKRIADDLGVSVDFLLTGDARSIDNIELAQEKQLVEWFRKSPSIRKLFILQLAEDCSRYEEDGSYTPSKLQEERAEEWSDAISSLTPEEYNAMMQESYEQSLRDYEEWVKENNSNTQS